MKISGTGEYLMPAEHAKTNHPGVTKIKMHTRHRLVLLGEEGR